MKRNRKLAFAVVMAAMLLVMLTAGCSGGNNDKGAKEGEPSPSLSASAEQTPENNGSSDPIQEEIAKAPVTLIMYLLGDRPAGQQQMLDELNTMLNQDLNVTLDIKNIPWGEWQAQYNLLFNSGEKFDIAYATAWADYTGIAAKGGFRAITDEELQSYLPLTAEDLQKENRSYLWDQVKVNGQAYMVPQNYEWQNPYGLLIRGDLREKYNIGAVKSYSDYLRYAEAIGGQEQGMIPINTNGNDDKIRNPLFYDKQWIPLAGLFSLASDLSADDGKVFVTLDTPEVAVVG